MAAQPDSLQGELRQRVAAGQNARAEHADYSTGAYSPSEIRALLWAFYSRINPERLAQVDAIVAEMETRIAAQSGSHDHRPRELVYSEIARLNHRLREKYAGCDLSLVIPHGISQQQQQQQQQQQHEQLQQQQQQRMQGQVGQGQRRQDFDFGTILGLAGCIGVTLDVPLEDLYRGKKVVTKIRRQIVCPICHGSGAHSSKTCSSCGGSGYTLARTMLGLVRMECSVCGGHGWVPTKKCSKCGGHGVLDDAHSVQVDIAPGTIGGTTITLVGQGDQAPHANAGDIILVINELASGSFRREGSHLHTDIYLTLEEALLGWSREVEHLGGEVLRVSNRDLEDQLGPLGQMTKDRGLHQVTPMDATIRIGGKGMLNREDSRSANSNTVAATGSRGDLFLHIKVEIPELTTAQQDSVKMLLA